MVENSEFIALLTLQNTPFLGDGSIKKLISIFGSAQEVLKQSKNKLREVDGIGDHRLKCFGEEEWHTFAKAESQRLEEFDIRYATYQDDHYPQRLKHCLDGPVILFYRGNIDWNNRRILSIVGTRKVTTYGQSFIDKLIADLAPLNPIIVSGFAYGVDIHAHKAAVKHGLQTVGVLAHGLNQMYPKVHAQYMAGVEKNGGFVTDFSTQTKFVHTNFLQRNRIIAGLSEATIVIESAAKGGSLVTADFANGYSRDVFAVPGRADDKLSLGCNNLIKQSKAHLLTGAADLLYILNWQIENDAPKVIQKQLFVELNDEEKVIWKYLKEKEREQLDLIALHCNLPTFKIASLLLNMEMKGLVRALPGKLFELI